MAIGPFPAKVAVCWPESPNRFGPASPVGHGGVTGGSGRAHLTQGDVGCDELEYSLPTAGNPKAPAASKITSEGLRIMLVNNRPGKILNVKERRDWSNG